MTKIIDLSIKCQNSIVRECKVYSTQTTKLIEAEVSINSPYLAYEKGSIVASNGTMRVGPTIYTFSDLMIPTKKYQHLIVVFVLYVGYNDLILMRAVTLMVHGESLVYKQI